ncbi:hypothetical protein B0H10DRAFT_2228970 [Mycena sp. CBHHK59/15]|nr:hypothetical protein B0H10DRAFT_2228970 [Mycena sp. CBHHK59/15]
MFAQQKRAHALSLDDDIEEITSLPGAPLKRIRTDPPARSGEEIELSSSDELADEEEEPVPEQVKELVDEGLRLCLVPTIRQRGGVGQGQGQEDGACPSSIPCAFPPSIPARIKGSFTTTKSSFTIASCFTNSSSFTCWCCCTSPLPQSN